MGKKFCVSCEECPCTVPLTAHHAPCTMLRTTHCVHGKDDARHYIFSRYMQPTDMRLLRFVRLNG